MRGSVAVAVKSGYRILRLRGFRLRRYQARRWTQKGAIGRTESRSFVLLRSARRWAEDVRP